MEGGPENRSRLRRHVRAAKEWLGRAEDSLNRSEDVRGDLNLMLARAELARAQETEMPGRAVLWTRRFLPLAAAFLIVGGSWLLWHPPGREVPPPRPTATMRVPLSAAPPIAGSETPAASPKAAEASLLPAEPSPSTESKTEEEPASAEIVPEEASARETEADAMAPETAETAAETSAPTVRVPSEEMQRLMSSAGQSLRAR